MASADGMYPRHNSWLNCCAFNHIARFAVNGSGWQLTCSFIFHYKIGFPGWPEPILDSVTGLGRQLNEEGGLHRPPFSFPKLSTSPAGSYRPDLKTDIRRTHRPANNLSLAPSLTVDCRPSTVSQKNERPVGGPAARAWGMEGNCNPKLARPFWPLRCAR